MNSYPVHKIIQGVDFEFDLMSKSGHYFFLVKSEDIEFEMHLNKENRWKIRGNTKQWIREIEPEIAEVINSIGFNSIS